MALKEDKRGERWLPSFFISNLIFSLSFTSFLLLSFLLRGSGVSLFGAGFIPLFLVGIGTFLLFPQALDLKFDFKRTLLPSLFLFLFFYLFLSNLHSHLPSFTDVLFFSSFFPFFYFLKELILRRLKGSSCFLFFPSLLLPLFFWSMVANWEKPSSFSPFLRLPWAEVYILFSFLFLSLVLEEESRIPPHSFFLSSLPFLYSLRESQFDFNFLPAIFLFSLSILGIFYFFPRLAHFSLERESFKEKGLILSLALVPFLIFLLSRVEILFGKSIPLPFDKEGLLGGFLTFLALIFLLFPSFYKRKTPFYLGLFFSLLLLSLSFSLLFLSYEKNFFESRGEEYFRAIFFSEGWEFLLPYLFIFISLMGIYFSFQKSLAQTSLFLLSLAAIFLRKTRLFYWFSHVPADVLHTLGMPQTLWQRTPLLTSFLYFLFFLSFFISLLFLYDFWKRDFRKK